MAFILDELIADLERRPHSPQVCNPYRLPGRSGNLCSYLEAMLDRPGRRILLVGEALGYRGGLHTGIPISSSALLRRPTHSFLRSLQPRIALEEDISEATATIVWDYLRRRRTIPLFWNAFPFHPHERDNPASNRAPTAAETGEGTPFLVQVAQLYRPQLIAGLGTKGTRAARRALPGSPVTALRHPSYGGKQAFIQGMDRLLDG